MNGRANVGIFVCTNEEIGTKRILNKTQIDKSELVTQKDKSELVTQIDKSKLVNKKWPILAYFNNGKSSHKECTKSYSDFKTYAELIKYCVDKLEENI